MTATMVIGASSSSTSSALQGKRKRSSADTCANVVAIPAAPLEMAVPVTGVNAAAPSWTTAIALATASRAARQAPPVPPPVTSGLGGKGLNPHQALGAVVVLPPVLAHAGGGPQLVPVPVGLIYGYAWMAGAGPSATSAAPPPSLPLAAALNMFHGATLQRMVSALMPRCHPPLWQHETRGPGLAPPPWWPTGSEPWWGPEVAAHLPTMAAHLPVPFVKGKQLRKAHRVVLLVAIVKHLTPDFDRVTAAVGPCGLSASEAALWNNAIENERARCVRLRPVLVVPVPQQQHASHLLWRQNVLNAIVVTNAVRVQQHGGNHLLPSHGVVHDAVLTWPAGNGSQVAVAAVLEQLKKQKSSAAAPGGGQQQQEEVIDLTGDDDGEDIVAMATTPTSEVHQVVSAENPEPEEDGDVAATVISVPDPEELEAMPMPLPVEQVVVDLPQPVDHHSGAAAETVEGPANRPWYENKELRRKFAHMPIGSPHSFDNGWYF
ncbi:hypothetical protein QOZ80_7BG0594430 [Eleusine coracana subsp. coracana]|nr:hypothetical protein QOZ80_7BG0594430 [Eleusine coracana subsp. coracana]